MKLIGRLLTSLYMFVLLSGGNTYGQDSAKAIRVNIPFEFSVGNKSFPAGNYSLAQPMQRFVVLRDERGQAVASAFTSGVDIPGAVAVPKLRFISTDGQHVLTELWQPQESEGQRLLVSRPGRTNFAKRHTIEAREAAEGSQP